MIFYTEQSKLSNPMSVPSQQLVIHLYNPDPCLYSYFVLKIKILKHNLRNDKFKKQKLNKNLGHRSYF